MYQFINIQMFLSYCLVDVKMHAITEKSSLWLFQKNKSKSVDQQNCISIVQNYRSAPEFDFELVSDFICVLKLPMNNLSEHLSASRRLRKGLIACSSNIMSDRISRSTLGLKLWKNQFVRAVLSKSQVKKEPDSLFEQHNEW